MILYSIRYFSNIGKNLSTIGLFLIIKTWYSYNVYDNAKTIIDVLSLERKWIFVLGLVRKYPLSYLIDVSSSIYL